MDQIVTLTSTRSQWEFALAQLRRWQDLFGPCGDEDRPEVGDRAIETVVAHLMRLGPVAASIVTPLSP